MWWGDSTVEFSWAAGWWQSISQGGMPETKASFSSQFIILRMKGKQTILVGWYSRCMLNSVYTVLGVNSWSWPGGMERVDLTLCSAKIVELCTRKSDGGWRWKWCGGYMRMGEINGMTCLSSSRRPHVGDIVCCIRTCTCHIGDGQLTCTGNSLNSQNPMMNSRISSHLSLACSPLYHRLRMWS